MLKLHLFTNQIRPLVRYKYISQNKPYESHKTLKNYPGHNALTQRIGSKRPKAAEEPIQ
ncbi:hypothetical protein AAE02nite_28950 [Adhaeribacter aerolatus]|uniref:Uncharacterized protein n=1 Tax=Adhaeribacter aerolatus TaxID=670289 RepID=A0A512AZT9_9BACT|nr:hypothetical protein AAE02nite_28950 [Adhaeribacter aerolatus]